MKIGILVDRITVGGVGKIAIEEVKALRKIGVDASLVVLKRDPKKKNPWIDSGNFPIVFLDDRFHRLFRISAKLPMFHFFSTFHLTYPLFIPFVVKKQEFDFLIVHGTFTCFTAISLKVIKKIPFASFIWDPIFYIIKRVYSKQIPAPLKSILLFLAEFTDKVIVYMSDRVLVGGKAHNTYLKSLKQDIKITVIPPSVHLLRSIKPKKHKYILMVTAWKKGKSPEYIFQIIDRMPDIKIKMVGKWLDENYLREFKQMVKEKKFLNNIEIVGEVNESELQNYYKNALVLLQTNDDRGFGMPALEAAACGTSFVIPKGQGVCEIFRDGIDGYYTKEKDTKDIVSKIEMFYQDKKKAITMGESAWRVAREKCSWKKHAEALIMVSQNNSI